MIKHWGKAETGMLIAAVLLLMVIFTFFEITASLMAIMEFAATELRRK